MIDLQLVVRNIALKILPLYTPVLVGTVYRNVGNLTSLATIVQTGEYLGTTHFVVEHLTNEMRLFYNLTAYEVRDRLYCFWDEKTTLNVNDIIVSDNVIYQVFSSTDYGYISIALAREFLW